jgi:quercetin dioxygenase-like cupin family protein
MIVHMQHCQWNPDKDGPLSETALVNMLNNLGYTCARYIYPAGTCFPDHQHDVDKIDAILQGTFKITMNGQSFTLRPGSYVVVPKKTIHSAEVIGMETVISIDAVKRI